MRHGKPGRQRGVALITVLLIVAIVTLVSAALIARQQLAIRSTGNQLQARQAWHYALGGEALAQGLLQRDLRTPGSDPRAPVDHLREPWARPLPAYPIEQGEIAVRIEDLAGRFNLNSLVQNAQANPLAVERFRRLLQRLGIEQPYAERLLDWLDPDAQTSGALGAEDNAYLLLQPAYRSANQALADVSELRLLLGMSEADFRRLQPHVSALPANVGLNVNTASALLLSCLADTLSVEQAQSLVAARGEAGYRTLGAFLEQPALAGMAVQDAGLSVGSQYFQVLSEVRLGERRQVLASGLERDAQGQVRVLWRNLGQSGWSSPAGVDRKKDE